MSKHVADIPKPFYCYVQNEFLYNFEKGFGEYTACLVYGLSAIPNRAWGLSLLLENGALVQHVPIHALTFNTPAVHHHPLTTYKYGVVMGKILLLMNIAPFLN